jgi:flagellar biosynthesis/type III secretory pathway M-ring protein FliF/YscJ
MAAEARKELLSTVASIVNEAAPTISKVQSLAQGQPQPEAPSEPPKPSVWMSKVSLPYWLIVIVVVIAIVLFVIVVVVYRRSKKPVIEEKKVDEKRVEEMAARISDLVDTSAPPSKVIPSVDLTDTSEQRRLESIEEETRSAQARFKSREEVNRKTESTYLPSEEEPQRPGYLPVNEEDIMSTV